MTVYFHNASSNQIELIKQLSHLLEMPYEKALSLMTIQDPRIQVDALLETIRGRKIDHFVLDTIEKIKCIALTKIQNPYEQNAILAFAEAKIHGFQIEKLKIQDPFTYIKTLLEIFNMGIEFDLAQDFLDQILKIAKEKAFETRSPKLQADMLIEVIKAEAKIYPEQAIKTAGLIVSSSKYSKALYEFVKITANTHPELAELAARAIESPRRRVQACIKIIIARARTDSVAVKINTLMLENQYIRDKILLGIAIDEARTDPQKALKTAILIDSALMQAKAFSRIITRYAHLCLIDVAKQ